jgi:hypothetical protein
VVTFPADNLATEFLIDGVWTDVTSLVRGEGDIRISRGRSSQSAQARPSTMQFILNDRTQPGLFNNRNPNSPYFGKIGRNTQVRQILRPGLADISDTFTRSVSNGWGSADTGQAYTTFSAGGSNVSDWNVDGSVGSMYVDGANEIRYAVMLGASMSDIDLTFTFAAPQATGATLEVGPVFRWTGTNDFDRPTVQLLTTNAVQLKGATKAGAEIASAVAVVSGLVHAGLAQPLTMRVRTFGQVIRCKVWAPSLTSEPDAWQLTYTSTAAVVPGGVGLRTFRNGSNTNTGIPTVYFDNLTVTNEVCLFSGEAPGFKTIGDQTRRDVVTKIEASGLLRRLQSGARPLDAALKRFVTTQRAAAAWVYWPFDEPSGATQWASAVSRTKPLPIPIVTNAATVGSDATSFPGAGALPVLGTAGFTTPSMVMPANGLHAVGFLMKLPGAGVTNGTPVIDWRASGTSVVRWELTIQTGGLFQLRGFSVSNVALATASSINVGSILGVPIRVAINLVQDGADIDWSVFVATENGGTVQQTGTFTSLALGRVDDVRINGIGGANGTTFGALVFSNSSTSVSQYLQAPWGFRGELAHTRFARLCSEEGILAEVVGTSTVKMGEQRAVTLVENLADVEGADRGIMYEPPSYLGLGYRTHTALTNQTARVSVAHGILMAPLEPLDDDANLLNRVTVSRYGGSSTTVETSAGPVSSAAPPAGVGLYDASFQANVFTDADTANLAGHILEIGQWDEARIPNLSFELAKAFTSDMLLIPTANEGDRVTLTAPPPWMNPMDLALFVRGVSMTLANSKDARGFRVIVNTSPYGPFWIAEVSGTSTAGDEFRVDVNARYTAGRTSTLAAGYNTTATSFSVASPADGLWSTAAASYPLRALVAGEEVSVTAVSGTSSPQTFTVTRSVNGVVKSQASGAEIFPRFPGKCVY